jgi:hypothetical protein
MSDGEDQLNGNAEKARKRGISKEYRVALVALVVLVVVVIVILAGMLDPFPKRKILKANEMSEVTGLTGRWEQGALHCYEDETPPFSSQQAAHSIMYFDNGTASLTVAITVAEMASPDKAKETYEGWVKAWEEDGANETAVQIGDEGMLNEAVDGQDDYYLHFRKGTYVVELHFSGNATVGGLLDRIAGEQAARL